MKEILCLGRLYKIDLLASNEIIAFIAYRLTVSKPRTQKFIQVRGRYVNVEGQKIVLK